MTAILKDKYALVTGGGKNLGALIATSLAQQGVNIAIHYNSNSSKAEAEATLEGLRASGVKAIALQADLTTAGASEKLFKDALAGLGATKLDIAINTVGKMLKKPIADITEAEYDSMFAINAKSDFFFLQQAGKHVVDGGCIITILTSLLAAFVGGYSVYQGSKAAAESFTKAAAKEYHARGIRVNAIAPGPMDTPFYYAQETEQDVVHHKAMGLGNRLTETSDIAPLVDFLCKDQWISGQTLFSNGGFTAR